MISTPALAPFATVPSWQETVTPDCEHVPCEGVAESKVTPGGSVSVSSTPIALDGPALATLKPDLFDTVVKTVLHDIGWSETELVNIIPGPIGVFRREVLTRVGGYDTDTFAEDADVTIKILGAGWQIVYEDRAIAWTEAPETVHELLKQRYRWTRGILQALRKRGDWLARPRGDTAVWISLQALLFEAIVWPVVNVVGNLLFAIAALSLGAASMVLHWWLLLTMLDLAAALHTVAMEEEDITLVPLAIPYRFFFITLIDVAKMFATVEEFARVQMTWGKLERKGVSLATAP